MCTAKESEVRKNEIPDIAKQYMMPPDDVQRIYEQCMEEGVLTDILQKYGTEVIEMYFRRMKLEEAMEMSREDGYESGMEAGYVAGQSEGRTNGIMDTLDKLILRSAPLAMIYDVVELPKDTILARVKALKPELLKTAEQN